MPLLADAQAVYLGDTPADKVYLGSQLVWSSGFSPSSIPGLVTWLDAANYTTGSWPNRGSGPAVTIPGTPAPTVSVNQLNGKPLVRFKTNEGRVRSTWPYPVNDWTLIYLVRWVGPGVGRAFSVQYPPSNMLVGMHTSQPDTMYDNGTWQVVGTGWNGWTPGPGPWRMYGADAADGVNSRFFVGGVVTGTTPGANLGGFTGGWGLSGYEATGTGESMDIEVAELVLYNRKLSDTERKQAEDYLYWKWLAPPVDADTRAYFTATGLDRSYISVVDDLVVGLKEHGLWDKMQAIYPFIGGTEALHKWNLKDPRDSDDAHRLTYTPGDGGHSTALGYKPNAAPGGAGYANTHLAPAGLLDPASVHLSLYSLTTLSNSARCDFGAYNWDGSTNRFHLIVHYTTGEFYYSLGHGGMQNVPGGDGSGLFVSSRTSINSETAYRNGAAIASNGNIGGVLPNVPLYVGVLNGYPNERSDLAFGFISIGAGLSGAEVAALDAVVETYQDALGRGTQARLWSPAIIPGLGLWLEADKITGVTNGGGVTTWPDSSGYGRQATPVAAVPQWMQAGMNGKPTVKFTNSRMTISGWGSALSGKTGYTLFQVLSQQSFGNYPVIACAPSYTTWGWINEFAPAPFGGIYWGHTNGSFHLYDAQVPPSTPTLLSYSYTNGAPRLFKNGTQITSYSVTGSGLGGLAVPGVGADVVFGAYYDGSYPLDDHVAAVIWYDHFLIDSERVQVENYLKSKYGIA